MTDAAAARIAQLEAENAEMRRTLDALERVGRLLEDGALDEFDALGEVARIMAERHQR